MIRYLLLATLLIISLGRLAAGAEHTAATSGTTRNDQPATRVAMNGFTIQLHRVDWLDRYKQAVDEIAAFGVDTVQFMVPIWQENGSSETVQLHAQRTPSMTQLAALIAHARARGLRTAVMPVLLLLVPEDREWRGNIHPASWENWFKSYGEAIVQIIDTAQDAKADLAYVGAELISAQKHADKWEKLIATVRSRFRGSLTYSCNWDNFEAVPFWSKLDLLAMNSYWAFSKGTTPEALEEAWKPIRQKVEEFSKKADRPLLFSEVAYHSVSNAADEPWDYTRDDLPIDLALQARLFEGFFHAWHDSDRVAGRIVFEWLPPGEGGPSDRGYSVQGKTAQSAVKKWFAPSQFK